MDRIDLLRVSFLLKIAAMKIQILADHLYTNNMYSQLNGGQVHMHEETFSILFSFSLSKLQFYLTKIHTISPKFDYFS